MHNFAIGIDTGGTFTDGVIFDIDNGLVIAKTKVITQRENLEVAINNCLGNLLNILEKKQNNKYILDNIRMVSLSTTLATNAIVEGQGADVGLILIGIDLDKKYPTNYFAKVKGKMDVRGKEREKLDLEGVKKAINELKGKVEAFAISGYMSIRNPMHELDVARVVKELTGYPTVCGHELSSDLGVYERTVTAVLNARLIPLITDLIEAVKKNLRSKGIKAPLMVVKGDGSLINEKVAMEKPVETILSGPAASVLGGKVLSKIENGVVVDMGGTTTDIALLRNGKPAINEQGATVGGWLTRVKAADISTIGLGGDSIVTVSKNRTLDVGPQKVYPIAWISDEYSHLINELKEIKSKNYFPISSQPTTVLRLIKKPERIELSDLENKVIKIIEKEPHTIFYVSKVLEKDPNLLPWERLVKIGSIHRAGLTPTDILHVTGDFQIWNSEASTIATDIMADRLGVSREAFIERVLDLVYFKIFRLIVESCIKDTIKISFEENTPHGEILKEMFRGKKAKDRFVSFFARLNVPVVALGAPVRAYFPKAVKKLNTSLMIPENADVANAIGTVNSEVIERVKITVKPTEGGAYTVYTPEGKRIFMSLNEAYDYGEEYGREYAYNKALEAGASGIEIIIERNESYSTLAGGAYNDRNKIFIETVINVTAKGKPYK